MFSFIEIFTIVNVLWRLSKSYWITMERRLYPYVFQINFYKYVFHLSASLQPAWRKKMSTIVLANNKCLVLNNYLDHRFSLMFLF